MRRRCSSWRRSRPSVVKGTLRQQLLYPKRDAELSEAELQKVLNTVNLADFEKRFEVASMRCPVVLGRKWYPADRRSCWHLLVYFWQTL